MILLPNNAEKAIKMLEKNYGGFDKIIEQLMEDSGCRNKWKTPAIFKLWGVVKDTFRISASAVGAAHGADPVGWCRHPTVCGLGQQTKWCDFQSWNRKRSPTDGTTNGNQKLWKK
jgi:hypothetical protein